MCACVVYCAVVPPKVHPLVSIPPPTYKHTNHPSSHTPKHTPQHTNHQVQLWRVAESVVRLTRPLMRDHVRILNCTSKDMPPVRGDSARIMQVVGCVMGVCVCVCFMCVVCVCVICALFYSRWLAVGLALLIVTPPASNTVPPPTSHSPGASHFSLFYSFELTTTFMQVLMNLVCSSLKYTHSGSIKISASQTHKCALVVVSDTGAGIPAQQLSQALDPFEVVSEEMDE